MKESFLGVWSSTQDYSADQCADLNITGHKVNNVYVSSFLFPLIGVKENELSVLDFGCGVGRNTFGMADYSEKWKVMGYDSEGMVSKTPAVAEAVYKKPMGDFKNLSFESDWSKVCENKFDCILCCLVLQHIHPHFIEVYINDFKRISKNLIVQGRRLNDFEKSTWNVIERCGLYPAVCSARYRAYGDDHEHITCYYDLGET